MVKFNRKPINLPNNNSVSRRKIHITLDDPLPDIYQSVLDTLPDFLPGRYRQKMEESAYYFWALEEGKLLFDTEGLLLQDKVELMAQQLANSAFAWSNKVILELYGLETKGTLPEWILDRMSEEKYRLNEEEIALVKDTYVEYTDKHAINKAQPVDQISTFSEGVPFGPVNKIGIRDGFKAYIENENLLDIDNLVLSLDELRDNGYHPQGTKLFEGDRLVLYWKIPLTDENDQSIRRIFEKHSVTIRGFAQDPWYVFFNDDGSYEFETFTSNDGSLGEGGHNKYIWRGETYDPGEFFHQYLRLVSHGLKDPTSPYSNGLVLVSRRQLKDTNMFDDRIDHVANMLADDGYDVVVRDYAVHID